MLRLIKRQIIAVALAGLLAACGGGGGGGDGGGSGGVIGGGSSGGGTGGGGTGGTPTGTPPTAEEASRLLTQATFGPTDAAIQEVISAGSINAWITAQVAKPLSSPNHLAYISTFQVSAGQFPNDNEINQTWWRHALTDQDQLRQRMAFALSQIFVVSLGDDTIDAWGMASYYDMLTRNALGNFRTLLEDVTLHPMMGRYLTYLGNQKEDNTRQPDENYAREVMQLMTIGLYELNSDGTPRLNNGQRIPTYTSSDISGLAKVFTGISWYHPNPTNNTFYGGDPSDERTVRPMSFYPALHSTASKTFLGITIPASTSTTVNVGAEIDTALDRLFNHVNTGPFISQRLIQQFVTSNPSPAYVGRVAAVFANNGSGVRGDLAAVIRAILTDTEARSTSTAVSSPSFGKLREPVIRLANWARAFGATSVSGTYYLVPTNASTDLSQSPLSSPSVFNFWRPGYTPPATSQLGQRNLVSPEFQIVDEVTAASYFNFIQSAILNGTGWTAPGFTGGPDLKSSYTAEVAIADNASALADRMNRLLFYGSMTPALRDRIIAGVNAVPIPAATGSNQTAINNAKLTRARTAAFFSMVSPEYLVQR